MTVLFYTHPVAQQHDPGPGHPEAPIRLKMILRCLEEATVPGLERREAPLATLEQIQRVHPELHTSRILAAVPHEGYVRIDSDTVLNPHSGEAALRASGAACAAVDAVMAGEAKRAFCAMRPPGHHAEPMTAMGFCLFNHVAVAAMQARAVHKLSRIAIFDWDVHHGNGTQDTFFDDPDTLYVSTHQSPLYPGTGHVGERGIKGNILNRPLPPGTGSQAWRKVVERDVLPAIDRWRPELILISAGFDAHAEDPLASFALFEEDFAWATRELVKLAEAHAQGRIVSVLEGGYDPAALARSVVAHLKALAEN
ncbi:histone deacetylase family protein [Benzoatithermus flavus]|uniref:Histone deacetylase family protein n=1 Tax=Benzoatithermus flavus TaxID=3108223 RepID=A0ABU8XSB7_9PROT